MEGDLTVTSSLGAGSVFSFSFVARTVARPVTHRDRAPGMAIGLARDSVPPKVLVVDDQAQNRALLGELFTTVGFQTRAVASGPEAIALHDTWRPDLILMDLRMPGMDGVAVIRQLRSLGSQAVIVALTASGLEEECAEALSAGAQETLSKPYREEHLLERIGALLGLHYAYHGPASSPPAAVASPTEQDALASALPELLSGIPDALREELRDAVIEARPVRILSLAEQVSAHSPAAADKISALVREFAYESLSRALGETK
jgi:CheY-like chemotaxis protein